MITHSYHQLVAVPNIKFSIRQHRLCGLSAKPARSGHHPRVSSQTQASYEHLAHNEYRHKCSPFLVPAVFYVALIYGYIISQITIVASTSGHFLTGSPYNFDAIDPGMINLSRSAGSLISNIAGGKESDVLIMSVSK